MYYTKKEANKSFDAFANKMNQIGNEIINQLDGGIIIERGGVFNPRADVSESAESFLVYLELAGVKKENVSINLNEEGLLVVKGKKENITFGDSIKSHRTERVFGDFSRNFQLPETADITKVSAKYDNGTLIVEIGKKELVKPKDVNISID
jgi:HSP20 family protein